MVSLRGVIGHVHIFSKVVELLDALAQHGKGLLWGRQCQLCHGIHQGRVVHLWVKAVRGQHTWHTA